MVGAVVGGAVLAVAGFGTLGFVLFAGMAFSALLVSRVSDPQAGGGEPAASAVRAVPEPAGADDPLRSAAMDYEAVRAGLEAAIPFNTHVGLEFVEVAEGRGVVRLPDGEHLQNHVGLPARRRALRRGRGGVRGRLRGRVRRADGRDHAARAERRDRVPEARSRTDNRRPRRCPAIGRRCSSGSTPTAGSSSRSRSPWRTRTARGRHDDRAAGTCAGTAEAQASDASERGRRRRAVVPSGRRSGSTLPSSPRRDTRLHA